MASKKLPKDITNIYGQATPPRLNKVEEKVLGKDQDDPKPYIVLKYYHRGYQCFSSWTKDELKDFSDLIEKMRTVRWSLLVNKRALGFKINKYEERLPHGDVKCLKDILSPDITFSELKVNDKARIHGFRIGAAFYLVWLDRNHEIFPMS